jgi:hypothetical protein
MRGFRVAPAAGVLRAHGPRGSMQER